MFGLALGCIGLTRREFQDLTPEEFNAVYQQWNQCEVVRYRAGWEQARFVAHCSLMPHARRSLRPSDLVHFDWENDSASHPAAPANRADFERIMQKFE